jgi:diadenosine tetraphosphatase ApaH/serine/threonine PP2A family protein phosphatase
MENFAVFDQGLCLVGHTHKPAIYRWRLDEIPGDDGGTRQHSATVEQLQPQVGIPIRLDLSSSQRLILNPGSVGQPRDNDARAAYAILDLEQKLWTFERIAYPIELTQSQMRAAGLPKRLVDRLSFGW